jgi:hypothetical protein
MVGMVPDEYKNLLLLLVQVLHDPRFRSNKLRCRNTKFHQLSEGSRETINEPVC